MICSCGCVLVLVPDTDDEGGGCGQGLVMICPECLSHRMGAGATIGDRPDLTPVLSPARN